MTDEVAIIQEQLLWWISSGFTPREALVALGMTGRGVRTTSLQTWNRVAEVALDRWRATQWTAAEINARRAA